MGGGLRHVHAEQGVVTEGDGYGRARRFHTQCLDHLACYRASERWRDCISDLARAMPFRLVEPEPVGETVKTRHLAHGDAARKGVVDRARLVNAPREASVPARRVFDTPSGGNLKKREIGSTLPVSVAANRPREISVWSVRKLEVSSDGSQIRGWPKCHESLPMQRSSFA